MHIFFYFFFILLHFIDAKQVCEREINLQRSESGKLLDGQRRDSKTKSVTISIPADLHILFALILMLTPLQNFWSFEIGLL